MLTAALACAVHAAPREPDAVSAGLVVYKYAPEEVPSGAAFSYFITIYNPNQVPEGDITFMDPLPEHTSIIPGSVYCSDEAATVVSEDPVQIDGITVPAGDMVTIMFAVTIDPATPQGTVINNSGLATDGVDIYYSTSNPEVPDEPNSVVVGAGIGATDWYIAEGTTGGGFDTWITLQNPGLEADARVTFSTEEGPLDPVNVTLPQQSRTSIRVADYVPDQWGVSTIVHSETNVVAERSTYWDRNVMGNGSTPGSPQPFEMKGGHSNLGVPSFPVIGKGAGEVGGRTTFFPEGATAGGFDTWVQLLNPGDQEANAKVTLMTKDGPVVEKDIVVPALTRRTVHLDEYLPDAFEVATEVVSDVPLIADRSMYWDPDEAGTEAWEMIGGNSDAGSPVADFQWLLAEGATGGGFETYVMLQNPQEGEAQVTLSFSNGGGVVAQDTATMPARSRATFRVGQYVPDDFNVSTEVTSDVPIVAERSTYWDNRQAEQPYEMMEGHATIGANMPSTIWMMPEGSTGVGFETFLTIFNPMEVQADVFVLFMTQEGPRAPVALAVPAMARRTVRVSDYAPNEFQVSAMVYMLGGGVAFGAGRDAGQVPVDGIVVERSMYWDRRGTSPFGPWDIRPYEMMGGSASSGMGQWMFR